MFKIITFYDININNSRLLTNDNYKTLQNNIGGYFKFISYNEYDVYFDEDGFNKKLSPNQNIKIINDIGFSIPVIYNPFILFYDNRFND